MNPTLYRGLRRLYRHAGFLRPFVRGLNQRVFRIGVLPPKFSGWEMSTAHEVPWADAHVGEAFRMAAEQVKQLSFTPSTGITAESVDALRWRHWVVTTAVRTAAVMRAHGDESFTAVECGVADGLTAYFILREMEVIDAGGRALHLYDSWQPMRAEDLVGKERDSEGRYADLELKRLRTNLAPFAGVYQVHRGYLPETLADGQAPAHVNFVHVDLNATKPTVAVCEQLWPRLRGGGVFLFDDYGWDAYAATKAAVDEFFASKPGVMIKFPTGQAMFLARMDKSTV